MGQKIVETILRRPRTTLCAGLLAAAFVVPALRHARTDFGYRNWFHEGDPLLERYDAFEARFGNDEAVVVAVHSPSGVFDPETAGLVLELTEALEAVEDVARVDSLTTVDSIDADGDDLRIRPFLSGARWSDAALRELERNALDDELARGYLVSADGKTTLLFAWLRSAPGANIDPTGALEAAREIVDARRGVSDHQLFIIGGPALIDAFRTAAEHDVKTLLPFAAALMLFFLALAFRSAPGVVLSFVVVLGAIGMTLGAAGLLGIPFNNVTAVVPQFLIAISVATTMHVLHGFYYRRASGASQREAARATLGMNFQPTLLTSVTTAVGFFSFATAAVKPIAHLGILSGLGCLFAWAITYACVGPLLVLLPLSSRNRARKPHPSALDVERFVRAIGRRRRPLLVLCAVGSAAAGLVGIRNTVNSDPLGYFAEDVPFRRATRFLEANLGGVEKIEVMVSHPEATDSDSVSFLSAADELQRWIDQQPFVTKTVSVLSFIKPLHRALRGGAAEAYRIPDDQALMSQILFLLPSRVESAYLDRESGSLRLSVQWTLHDANATIRAAHAIENKARALGLDATATGKNLLYSQLNEHVVQTFVVSLGLALVSVSLLLVVALRSFTLGVLALIPNVVPLLFGAGFLKLLGKPLDIGTVIVSSVCLGIAVDDTIHFLTHYNERRERGSDPASAIVAVLRSIGPALVGTTVVLAGGFGLLAFASFVPNQNFGVLVSFALAVALFADLVLLPALLLSSVGPRVHDYWRNVRMNANRKVPAMRKIGCVVVGVLVLGRALCAGELDGRAIAERTLERNDGHVVFRTVSLISCDFEVSDDGVQRCASEPRQKRFQMMMENIGPKRHDVLILYAMDAPAAEKGISFLQRNHAEVGTDSEQWLYLPALKKAKRIMTEASGPKRGHLFGSELAYEDLEPWHLEEFTYALLEEESISGRRSWVLELTPTATRARRSSYEKMRMWIDQESWLPLRVDAFKTGADPVKTIHNRNVENRDGVWLARETVVVNHESERMSLFKVTGVVVNPELDPNWSHARALEDDSYRNPVFVELARQSR